MTTEAMLAQRPERVEALIAWNAARFSITRAAILRVGHQTRNASAARQQIALRLYEHGWSVTSIARWLNYRDHTPVVYLLGKIGTQGPRRYNTKPASPPPDRHPHSFVVRMAEELRERWAI